MSKRKNLQCWLPALLFVMLCAVMLVTVFTQAKSYGVTMDEPLQDNYGHSILAWYKTLGRDTSFLAYPTDTYMPEHGAIFDAMVALAQRVFGYHWYTRAVMTGLAGVAGVIAIALCGYEIGDWWCALLAALGLWLYPRYFGAIFNNPKDIPFAAAMTWVIWSVLFLMKRWESEKYFSYCMLVGFCIGFAASIRVTAIIWGVQLALLVAGWWLIYGVKTWQERQILPILIKQVIAGVVIGLTSLLTMIALWPYIFLSPFAHLYDSIIVMSRYPWNGTILFNGVVYPATQLPRIYALAWLVIGSPPSLMLCVVLGIVIVGLSTVRKHVVDPKLAVVLLAFLVPLASLVVLHTVLYNALRQFLFLVPPMILVAVYGVKETIRILVSRRKKAIAVGFTMLLLVSYVLVVIDMVNLHPYEYIYFSPVVGGLPEAAKSYETDYYASCDKASAQWLALNYQHYTKKKSPSVQGITYFETLITIYLPNSFHIDPNQPDFYIEPIWAGEIKGSYHTIHVESRQGVPLCFVKVKD